MKKKSCDIAVVGATGLVGETILTLLEDRNFPAGHVYPVASERSVGQTVKFNKRSLTVESLEQFDFSGVQIALFSAGSDISGLYAPKAVEQGCIVIDNTSCFRYEDEIPLIIPEVNLTSITDYTKRGIIANPNCSTIQMLVALKPLHDAATIRKINVATYQSVSGAGKKGISELASQTSQLLGGVQKDPEVFSAQIAFNAIPHIDDFMENGYTKEEMKMVWETWKILGDKTIQVSPTCVRVPVFYGHAEAIHIETEKNLSAEEARALLEAAPGVSVMDDRAAGGYPTQVSQAFGTDDVFVGRIREDIGCENGISLWVVADNVRKGAALNSVQIAEELINSFLEC